ncbi:MAG: hypothetical protein CMI54_02215 [Parcubacteria group bacterium]|nr:hypothetical protein [Parcubacteria group bacterium]|tara:strand:- start:1148 stop:1855 length:708 start_codon:yes stop_codon:yes gene_type:complete
MKLKKIKRDDNGLITGGSVNYIFNEDGFIDWRKMIKTEHLVPNRQKTSETDVTKLKDTELIILLGGIKELAQVRGYTDVRYDVKTPASDYVVAICSMTFIPNYETESKEVTFSAIGDAGPHNTHGFGQQFLAACAENRAFVRCVRSFLRISIVANEELPKMVFAPQPASAAAEEHQASPATLLKNLMKEKNVTFETLKKKLEKENYEKVEKIMTVENIPKSKIFELIDRMKKIKA